MAVATMPTNTYQDGTGRKSRKPRPVETTSATQGTPQRLIFCSPPGSSPFTDSEYAVRPARPTNTQPVADGESTASLSSTTANQANPAAVTASSSGAEAQWDSISPCQSPGVTLAASQSRAPMNPICRHM